MVSKSSTYFNHLTQTKLRLFEQSADMKLCMFRQLISSATFLCFMSVTSLLISKRAIRRFLVTVISTDTY